MPPRGNSDLSKKFGDEVAFDIDCLDNHAATPLHKAAKGGHTDVIRFLLKNGANINAQDVEGATPVHKAVFFQQPQVL